MATARWWKIDFHTHSPASRGCFRDQEVTGISWVKAAIEAGLDGVVLTDHNSTEWIEEIRTAANLIKEEGGKQLIIYPGIELCVGLEYLHILVIFDPEVSIGYVNSFIAECGIKLEQFANTEKHVDFDKFCRLVKDYEVLVIPAHFCQNKGLGRELRLPGIKEFAFKVPITAIEVRNDDDIREVKNKYDNEAFKELPAIVTGSDNPGSREGEHSILGFGERFTWIKLSKHSLESLRQAFIDPSRIKLVFDGENQLEDPNIITHSYLAGMNIKDLKHVDQLNFRLSPHLNCIIGSRGSGKSTILEMARMTLEQIDEKAAKKYPLIADTTEDNSTVEVYYNFGSTKQYRITASGKKRRRWIVEDDSGEVTDYPDFPVMIFSQKEIFNLVEHDADPTKKDKSPILAIIDDNISSEKIKIEKEIDELRRTALRLSEELASVRKQMEEIPKLKGSIQVADSKMELFRNTGVINKKELFDAIKADYAVLTSTSDKIQEFIRATEEKLIEQISSSSLALKDSTNTDVAVPLFSDLMELIEKIKLIFTTNFSSTKEEIDAFKSELEKSTLKKELLEAQKIYESTLQQLQGFDTDSFKETEEKKQEDLDRLKELESLQPKEESIIYEIEETLDKIHEKEQILFGHRVRVASSIQERAKNIALNIHFMSHGDRWLAQIREDLGKATVFDEEFEDLLEWLFPNKKLDLNRWREWSRFLLANNRDFLSNVQRRDGKKAFSDKFEKMWETKNNHMTVGSLFSIRPEDRVEIRIKNNGSEMSINDGSPGQKSAAILAFILNQGTKPLIIDQPEDDLDNSLIIELIVANITNMKNNRQIIIVTHNPNIPVLGDAEGIIMLDKDQRGKVVFKYGKKTGCIEESSIKKGICDIMEGGITAFKRRESKYKYVEV